MVGASQRVSPVRFGLFVTAWALVAVGSFLLFSSLIDDGSFNEGQTELACAKSKLETMWRVPLPESVEVVGSVPRSRVVSADWDLKDLGCSGSVHPTVTLDVSSPAL